MLLGQLGRLRGGEVGAGCWSTTCQQRKGTSLGSVSVNSGNGTAGPPRRGSTQGRPTASSPFPSHVPASALTEKINIRVLDPFTIKPLDRKLILDSARATKGRILTVEDHYYEGEGPRQRARAAGAGEPGRRLDTPPLALPWEDQLWPRKHRAVLRAAGPGHPANSQGLDSLPRSLPPRIPATQEASNESHLTAKSGKKVACVPGVVVQNQTGKAIHHCCLLRPYRAVLHNPRHLLPTGEGMGLDSGDKDRRHVWAYEKKVVIDS